MCFLHYTLRHTHTHTHMITNISGIYRNTTMNVLMFYQTTLYNVCPITTISYMNTQHSACLVDVLSDCCVD